MTVDRECESLMAGVEDIRKACQLLSRCDGHVRSFGQVWQLPGRVPVLSEV